MLESVAAIFRAGFDFFKTIPVKSQVGGKGSPDHVLMPISVYKRIEYFAQIRQQLDEHLRFVIFAEDFDAVKRDATKFRNELEKIYADIDFREEGNG